jgi:hypothetical protein
VMERLTLVESMLYAELVGWGVAVGVVVDVTAVCMGSPSGELES